MEFPRWMYHRTQDAVIVNDSAQQSGLLFLLGFDVRRPPRGLQRGLEGRILVAGLVATVFPNKNVERFRCGQHNAFGGEGVGGDLTDGGLHQRVVCRFFSRRVVEGARPFVHQGRGVAQHALGHACIDGGHIQLRDGRDVVEGAGVAV